MIKWEDAEGFAKKIEGATNRVAHDYATGDLTYEEPFSDQLCGRLKETLQEFETPNFRWQADIAEGPTRRGRLRARTLKKFDEEPAFGADIVMSIDIEAADYKIRKGFLVQAKRLEPGKELSATRRGKLVDQCERMLSLTPSSMVFLYHGGGVHAVPATSVFAARAENIWRIPTWGYRTVYIDFVMCWFGDPRLQSTDPLSLEALRTMVDAPLALRVAGREKDRPTDAPLG